MKAFVAVSIVGVCFMLMAAPAGATVIHQSGSVSFTSDLEPTKIIELDSFDLSDTTGCPPGQSRQLNSVTVTVTFDGSAEIAVDNDDPFQGGTANARIIRSWSLTGPGSLAGSGSKTVATPPLLLDPDDGDLTVFDILPPDGFDFVGLGFSNLAAFGSPYSPTATAYETIGPGKVHFPVDVSAMVNDIQWGRHSRQMANGSPEPHSDCRGRPRLRLQLRSGTGEQYVAGVGRFWPNA